MGIFWTLVKMNLNVNFGISALKYKFTREKKKRWEPVLIFSAVTASLFPIVILYIYMMRMVFEAGIQMKQPQITLTSAFVFEQMFVLIFGMFYIMGTFYFSKDIEILTPLPIKPYQVLGSKFLVVMVNEYLTVLPLMLPPLFIYGLGTGQGAAYWLKGVVLILASPVIPLAAASLFIVILMRFVNVRKSKDLFAIIGGFLGVFLSVGLNYFFSRMGKQKEEELLRGIFASKNSLVELVGRRFPPAIWATRGLSEAGLTGLVYFLLFLSVSAGLLAALLWLSNHFFYKGLLSGQEAGRKRRTPSRLEAVKGLDRLRSPIYAVFLREWKLLLRTPVYVLNGLTGSVLGPLMLVFMVAAQRQSKEIKLFAEAAANPDLVLPVSLGGLGLMLITSGMNIVASTAVSREGRYFWIARMIPISPRQQVTGKLIHALAISALGVFTTAVLLVFFIRLGILRVILLAFMGLLGALLLCSLGLITDVIHPKLVWNSPQEAMKQNINGILSMLITLIVISVTGGMAVLLIKIKVPEWMVYPTISIMLAVFAFLSVKALYSLADIQYMKYDI